MIVILCGSQKDLDWAKGITGVLEEFSIKYKIHIASAHKSPQYLLDIINKYDTGKEEIIYICVAGRSNALGGMVDANTNYPVINCPPPSDNFAGMDILSSLRMPTGVVPLTILDSAGAALAAIKILSLKNKGLQVKIIDYQQKLRRVIIDSDKEINK